MPAGRRERLTAVEGCDKLRGRFPPCRFSTGAAGAEPESCLMPLTRLIYASHPFGFDDLVLTHILKTAQRNNAAAGITGTLICREDLYLQLLEGERAAVESLYEKIKQDDRHADVITLVQETAAQRLFPTWAMRHDPARSWMWTREDVSRGAVEAAPRDEVLAIFIRLVAEAPGPLSGLPRACPFTGVKP
jgi:hypothetical protein